MYGLQNVTEGVPGDRRERTGLARVLAIRNRVLLEFLTQTIQFFCMVSSMDVTINNG